MNDDPLKNIVETSDYLLAYEATFGSMCADDKSAILFTKISTLIGPEATLRLALAFGGKSLRIPRADLFTRAASVTGAALKVLRKKIPIREAAKEFSVQEEEIKRTLAILREHEKFRKKVQNLYSEKEDIYTLDDIFSEVE